MMCSGSREYLCWNGFSVKGYEAAKLVSEAVFKKIEALREFDTHFLEQLQLSITDRMKHLDSEQAETGLELKQLEGQLGNVTDAISKSGFSEALRGKLEELEARRRELRTKLEMSKRQPRPRVIIPSIAELKTKARETMTRLAITSPEFYRLICRLIPEMHVIPYRLIEGKSIGLRIHFTLDLAPFLATSCDMDQLEGVIRHPMTVDLFDLPTREMIRKQVIDLRKQGTFIRAVAAQLGHSPLEVQRAMKIQKMMESSGLPDPWIRLNKAPDDYRNLSRHRHKRFQFQPKPGYPLL
jgi:hypothetical protein